VGTYSPQLPDLAIVAQGSVPFRPTGPFTLLPHSGRLPPNRMTASESMTRIRGFGTIPSIVELGAKFRGGLPFPRIFRSGLRCTDMRRARRRAGIVAGNWKTPQNLDPQSGPQFPLYCSRCHAERRQECSLRGPRFVAVLLRVEIKRRLNA